MFLVVNWKVRNSKPVHYLTIFHLPIMYLVSFPSIGVFYDTANLIYKTTKIA